MLTYILESLAEIIFFATANFLVFFCFPIFFMTAFIWLALSVGLQNAEFKTPKSDFSFRIEETFIKPCEEA